MTLNIKDSQSEVYPHVCGATIACASVLSMDSGLSPRVWGNLPIPLREQTTSRSIPTCVGQPPARYPLPAVLRVYPHVCGATIFRCVFLHNNQGLSPRVWGNPCLESCLLLLQAVYPHVCGATRGYGPRRQFVSGLSPRVWGNPSRRWGWNT